MKKNGEYVGVDEKFIPEEEKYVNESILGNKAEAEEKIKGYVKKGGKIVKKIGIGYLCFLAFIFAFMIGIMIYGFTIFNNARKTQDEMMSLAQHNQDKMISSVQQHEDEAINSVQHQQNEAEKQSFNNEFELYSGTSSRLFVTTLLDNVVTNNKKNTDKIITVIYNETITADPNEIVELKQSFEQGKDYEIMLDYDTNGLVNKVTIKDI